MLRVFHPRNMKLTVIHQANSPTTDTPSPDSYPYRRIGEVREEGISSNPTHKDVAPPSSLLSWDMVPNCPPPSFDAFSHHLDVSMGPHSTLSLSTDISFLFDLQIPEIQYYSPDNDAVHSGFWSSISPIQSYPPSYAYYPTPEDSFDLVLSDSFLGPPSLSPSTYSNTSSPGGWDVWDGISPTSLSGWDKEHSQTEKSQYDMFAFQDDSFKDVFPTIEEHFSLSSLPFTENLPMSG